MKRLIYSGPVIQFTEHSRSVLSSNALAKRQCSPLFI